MAGQDRTKEDLLEALKRNNDLLGALSETQDLYISGVDIHTLFDLLLKHIISLTGSTYGFIGEALYTTEGALFLRTYAVTNVAWNDATRKYYEEFSSKGLEFYNLKTLFGAVLATGKPVISNDPAADPRRGGLPDGHPAMHSFLGIPIHHGGDFCGMVGIANRTGGFAEEVIEYLRPFLKTCGFLIEAKRTSEGRRRAERALRESEQRFRTLADHAPVGIFQTDAQGDCTYVNAVWCALTGMTAEQAMGKGWVKALHPEDAGKAFKEWNEGDRGRREFTLEYRYITPSGAVKWVIGKAMALLADDGTVTGYVGSVVDITERTRMEESLRQSRERLNFLVSSSPAVIYTALAEGNFGCTYISDNVRSQLGYEPRQFTEDPEFWARHIHPDDVGRVFAGMPSLFELGLHRHEYRFQHEDGTYRWMYDDLRLVRDSRGNPREILGYWADITQRKQAEESLRQSEQFNRTILDSVDEGFLVIDRDYRILTANKAFCAQVDTRGDDVIGKHCYEVSHKTHQPCFQEGEDCATRQVFATGAPHTATHRHRDARGGIVYVETKCFPIKDDSGAVTSVIETINNITERRLLEEERLKTQKLESIGMLAGGIAHDFNNLLQGVFGYISMAKLTFDQREKSQTMLEQAEKALHLSVNLTNQLLTFSKGGKPVKKRTFLLPVIENAVKFALSGSRSEYRITSDPGLWQVDADEGQLGQVIQNIVLNADQAMPLGGSVVICARNLPAADEARPQVLGKRDHVLVSIQDTGAGMPSEYLGRIFDPYFTTKEKGSGLGLATSYSIIRNHDGLIDVQSELGKGSTFRIYLPASAATEAKPRQEAVPTGVRVGRILVMDDEEIVRKVVGELLAALGHTTAFTDKGETALEAYRSARESGRPFDVVILDLTIRGGMGGEETIRKLLEIDPDVKAVVSSGYSDAATLANYRQVGFKAFLKKPYNMQELQSTLDVLLA